jgi:hypothetical protein
MTEFLQTDIDGSIYFLLNLAGNVGDMLAKCWRYVKMLMNLGILACGC